MTITPANKQQERKQINDELATVTGNITTLQTDVSTAQADIVDLQQVNQPADGSTSPYTLNTDGEIVEVDLGGSAKTVNLPATLTVGRCYGAIVYNSGASATFTFGRNGHTMRYKGNINGAAGGSADDWTLTDGGTIVVVAVSSSVVEAAGYVSE